MVVEVEATFNSKDSAYNAFSRINHDFAEIKSADLVTKKSLHNYIEEVRDKQMKHDLVKYSLWGLLLGFVIASLLNFIFNSSLIASNVDITVAYVFLAAGLITGLLCSVLIYFIMNEKTISVSESDLDDREALIMVSVQNKMLPKLKRMLFNNGAKSVTSP